MFKHWALLFWADLKPLMPAHLSSWREMTDSSTVTPPLPCSTGVTESDNNGAVMADIWARTLFTGGQEVPPDEERVVAMLWTNSKHWKVYFCDFSWLLLPPRSSPTSSGFLHRFNFEAISFFISNVFLKAKGNTKKIHALTDPGRKHYKLVAHTTTLNWAF